MPKRNSICKLLLDQRRFLSLHRSRRKTYAINDEMPIEMRVNGNISIDYQAWQKNGTFFINGDLDGDSIVEIAKEFQ
jgi:hypothetical protein